MTDDVRVVVDTAEPPVVQGYVLDHPDVTGVRRDPLSAADLVVNGVGIERKTPMDFSAAMVEGRLREQVEKLAATYDVARILLEGSFDHFDDLDHTGINPDSLRGMAARCDSLGVPVVPTGGTPGEASGHARLVDHAVRLGRKHATDPSAYVPTGRLGRAEDPGLRMWACLPGVGPELAERCFEFFGPPTRLMGYEDYDGENVPGQVATHLQKVDGIGPTTAEAIAWAMWLTDYADYPDAVPDEYRLEGVDDV